MADLHPGDHGGNAEALHRYWTVGEGGTEKIRWNTPGDWTRCHRHLEKYVGPEQAARQCAIYHREMTGFYPGAHGGKNPEGPG